MVRNRLSAEAVAFGQWIRTGMLYQGKCRFVFIFLCDSSWSVRGNGGSRTVHFVLLGTNRGVLHLFNMSTPLERVQHLLVTPDNPPRQIEGLDVLRCVELHNAILEHGWLSSGRSAEDFQSQCNPFYESAAERIDEKCTASLRAFLQGARHMPPGIRDFNFFYNVSGLTCEFGWHDYYVPEENRALTLYSVSAGLSSKPDGLV
jgi:hypothetical protein